MNRRSFLTTATGAAAGVASLALGADRAQPAAGSTGGKERVKLGIATYSYWHFRDPKVSIEQVIDKSAEIGVEALDILHRQMDIPEKEPLTAEHRSYLRKLKRHAFRNGVGLICLSIHQNFVSPDKDYLMTQLEHTHKCLDIAYELGIPCLRINSGRWNTIKDFDELMKARGIEPAIPGYKEEE